MSVSERLQEARRRAGYDSAAEAARAFGWNEVTYRAHETGMRGLKPSKAEQYAKAFRVTADWLLFGTGASSAPAQKDAPEPVPNAKVIGPTPFDPNDRMPVYGQAVGGVHGEFILNGNKIDDVLVPPFLRGVKGAYGVYAVGDSMEPRYYAGEVLYINPHLPARKGHFVVAQIASRYDGDPPLAFIKRFVNMDASVLRLEQFNPAEILTFPRERVVSIHKIVGSGDG